MWNLKQANTPFYDEPVDFVHPSCSRKEYKYLGVQWL